MQTFSESGQELRRHTPKQEPAYSRSALDAGVQLFRGYPRARRRSRLNRMWRICRIWLIINIQPPVTCSDSGRQTEMACQKPGCAFSQHSEGCG
jgi:hypothetical protein